MYGDAWSSIGNKEGQTTELPLPVHSYITVCTGRWIEIQAVQLNVEWKGNSKDRQLNSRCQYTATLLSALDGELKYRLCN
jgi:hypothetical protein